MMQTRMRWPGVLALALAGAASAETRFVDDDAPPGGDGLAWATAYRFLQDALLEAEGNGAIDEIRVGQGTYRADQDEGGNVSLGDRDASFTLVDGVEVRGGFRGLSGGGSPDERDVATFVTTLYGDLDDDDDLDVLNVTDNTNVLVRSPGAFTTSTLDGFTVTRGFDDGQSTTGGMTINGSATVTVANCTFTRNYSSSPGVSDDMRAGGTAPVTLKNCSFVGVPHPEAGASIRTFGGVWTIDGCSFTNHAGNGLIASCGFDGPGVSLTDSTLDGLGTGLCGAPGTSLAISFHPPAPVVCNGSATILDAGVTFEIAGPTPGSGYGQLQVTGSFGAFVDSALFLTLGEGFEPTAGQTFDLITYGSLSASGQFDVIHSPQLGDNLFMQVSYVEGAAAGGSGMLRVSVTSLAELIAFDAEDEVAVGGMPTAAAVGDFNDDGLDDLAVTVTGTPDPNVDPGQVLVFLNNDSWGTPGPGFTQAVPGQIAAGIRPSGIVAADLDGGGDGFADLAVSNEGSDSVSVLLNATGTFAAATTIAGVGADPSSIATAELTGDAFIDLVVTNEGDDTLQVLANDGTGTFAPAVAGGMPTQTGSAPGGVEPADLDNDKDIDLVVSNQGDDTIMVFERLGPGGGFAAPTTIDVGISPTALAIGDLDADPLGDPIADLPDIVVSNSGSTGAAAVSVVRNEGGLSFGAAQPFTAGTSPGSIELIDLEPDGDLDIAVVAGTPDVDRFVDVLRNDSDGNGINLAAAPAIAASPSSSIVRRANLDDLGGDDLVIVTDEPAATAVAGIEPAVILPLLNTPALPGDANGDDMVDVGDLLAVLADWGDCSEPCPPFCTGDVNEDCAVDVTDLLLVLAEWGAASAE